MPKISDEPLEAIQTRLFKSDLDYLRSLFRGSFGVNRAIRNIVRSYVVHTKALAAQHIDQQEASDEAKAEAEMEELL
jgi:hypothetical protein